MSLERFFFSFGSLSAALAVAAGAYGAHAEGGLLNAIEAQWVAKAARYQMYHGFALIAVTMAMKQWPSASRLLTVSGFLFILGIFCFSGSLYLMAFVPIDAGYVTPLGGVAMILAWFILAIAPWSKTLTDETTRHS
jgi:uncharacterized membrane protein YgdD (TMEM256/DUF423 family)